MKAEEMEFLRIVKGHLKLLRCNLWKINPDNWIADCEKQWSDRHKLPMSPELFANFLILTSYFMDIFLEAKNDL